MSYIPTDEQWAKMQKHIKSSNYKKDDFFVFETLAVGDKVVPNRYIKIMPDLLNTMKEDAEKGVSLMLNHNWSQEGVQSIPIGKVFDARIGEGTQEGESMALYTTQYILRDDSKVDGYSKNDIIKLIETGILADTSIGWGTTRESYKCSICQNSIYDWRKCDHIPGRKYIVNEETNEVKECIIEAHSPAEKHAGNNVLMENSIVFDGAYPNAIIQSKIGEKQGAKGEMLQVIEGKENLDVSENDIIIGYTSNRSINLLHKQIAEKGGMEQMSKVDETELVETPEVETQNNEVEETTNVTTEPVETTEVEETEVVETVEEVEAENTQSVDEVDNSVETEKMYSEKEILEKFGNICDNLESLVKLAKEGLDCKILENVIFATPVKDYAIVVQCIGRCQRPYEGKTLAKVFDFVDDVSTLKRFTTKRKNTYKKMNYECVKVGG